jgi:hypothetical protein
MSLISMSGKTTEENNMHLMQTLDDAWNSQDWKTFGERHAENVAVFWPGQPEPTRGVYNHREESIAFFKAFPDNHIANNPYKIFFANGDYTCSVPDFTGTFKGQLPTPEGSGLVLPNLVLQAHAALGGFTEDNRLWLTSGRKPYPAIHSSRVRGKQPSLQHGTCMRDAFPTITGVKSQMLSHQVFPAEA